VTPAGRRVKRGETIALKRSVTVALLHRQNMRKDVFCDGAPSIRGRSRRRDRIPRFVDHPAKGQGKAR